MKRAAKRFIAVLQARLPRRRLEALVRQSLFVSIVLPILVEEDQDNDRDNDEDRQRS